MTFDELKDIVREVVKEMGGPGSGRKSGFIKDPNSGIKPFDDQFTNLSVSRQRKWQLRKKSLGKCMSCGNLSFGKKYCNSCQDKVHKQKNYRRQKMRGAKIGFEIEESFNRPTHQTPTLKYHENAKLQVAKDGKYGPFLFFRNGQPFALVDEFGPERRGDEETYNLGSIAIIRSLRKVGLGRAIFTYLFDSYPKLQNIELHSSKVGKPFYQKIGGEREPNEKFIVTRNKFSPSPLKFTEIPFTFEMRQSFPSFFKSIWK